MRPHFALALTVTLAGSLSCGRTVTGFDSKHVRVPIEDVRIAITASASSGAAGQPITVTATIQNRGNMRVAVQNRCPDPIIHLYDAQSIEMFQRDPTQPVACPAVLIAPLEPGEQMAVPLTFDGGFYSQDGQHHQAPAGSYKAVTVIVYSVLEGYTTAGDPRTVSREVHFTWQ